MEFGWDENKASKNIKKHGISFREAVTVFFDDNALLLDDPDHSFAEERFLLLGMSSKLRLLTVVHCEKQDSSIRIISARRATKSESKEYFRRLS